MRPLGELYPEEILTGPRCTGDFHSRFGAAIAGLPARNLLLIPSFVDVHVHLREPGFFYKESIATGSLAAAKGGYSHIFAMPNLDPVPDSLAHLQIELDLIARDAVIDVRPYGAITVGEKGGALADLAGMAPFVAGFSDDGVGLNDPALMRQAMVTAKALGRIIAAHCEDMRLRDGGYIHDGAYARAHGHRGIPSESEWLPVAGDLMLAAETGCDYHVCHVSTRESVDIIRRAKAAGVPVTCETAPHYLLLSDADLQEDGCFKMNPPLRGPEDREAVLAGLLDGTIDMIATDHAPHSAAEKAGGLRDSAMGISGLEAAFPILFTRLVRPGRLPLQLLLARMCHAPRRRFGLPTAEKSLDYALWDVSTPYVLDPATFVSKGKSTPFAGEKVYGRCLLHVSGGRVVWQDPALSVP